MLRQILIFAVLLSVALPAAGVLQDQPAEDPPAEQAEAPVENPKPQGNPPEIPEEHRERITRDIELGENYSQIVAEEYEFSENQDYIEMVERIGNDLAVIANERPVEVLWGDNRLSPFHYRFFVVKDDEVNAFSIPGGYIYIFEGLIEFAESEDEVAGVIAHEIAHASFRHIDKMDRERGKLSAYTLPVIIGAILAGNSEGLAWAKAAEYAGQAYQSSWSVDAEVAADHGAIQYMVDSGYNPVALMTFMERLAISKKSEPEIEWGIFRTHPPSVDRRNRMLRTLDEYGIAVRRSEVTQSFSASVSPADDGRLELRFGDTVIHHFGGNDAITRAEEARERVNRFMDTKPQPYLIRSRGDDVLGGNRVLFSVVPDDGTDIAAAQAAENLSKAASILSFNLSAVPKGG